MLNTNWIDEQIYLNRHAIWSKVYHSGKNVSMILYPGKIIFVAVMK